MGKSLHIKLFFIILLVIILLMAVVCVFLVNGVQGFYREQFYMQMQSAFSDAEMVSEIRDAAKETNGAEGIRNILAAYSGTLGVNTDTRNFYILSGNTGSCILSSDGKTAQVDITPNILTAIAGQEGYAPNTSAEYMDVALPVSGGENGYILYIKDNMQTVQALSREMFHHIMEALLVGLVISIIISFVLSRTLLRPIRGMTKAAEEMAQGDFSRTIEVQAEDEIGVLARTFNNMAAQLDETLEEIKRSESLRREFVANASHELRTPITSIRSYAETLVDSPDMPKDMEEDFLKVIMNESDRMTKIVQDLLELSRLDAGKENFVFEKFNVVDAVENVEAAIALEAKRRGHVVTVSAEEGLPCVVGDKAKIEQVFLNIMTNAVKYTPDGGEIHATITGTDGMVSVAVHDTGIGIPQEDMARVFDRFYRVDKARARESGGTGLGLSIAKEIVEKHKGSITMTSVPGEGTTVTVCLRVDGPADA